MEKWKVIENTKGNYEISTKGRLKTHNWKGSGRTKIMRPAVSDGYSKTIIVTQDGNKSIKIHRLVAEAFIPNPENKPQVNHKDGNKVNNNVENLEWCTHRENIDHAIETGLWHTEKAKRAHKKLGEYQKKYALKGEETAKAKLTEQDVKEIRQKFKPRIVTREMLGKEYGVKACTIKDIVLRKSWKHVQ